MLDKDLLRYQDVLKGCSLFQGMDEGELSQALHGLKAYVARFEKGDAFYRPGDAVKEASLLLEGLVVVENNDAEGSRTTLNVLEPGDEFGTHRVLSDNNQSTVYVCAGSDCAVLMLDILALQTLDVSSAPVRRMYDNLLRSFAGKCIDLYYRVQIYGKKRIRSRIRLYLMTLEERDGEVELPMNRTALAAYLGVDRTALARELGRMQQEGLVAVHKRRVRLLNRDFFQGTVHG